MDIWYSLRLFSPSLSGSSRSPYFNGSAEPENQCASHQSGRLSPSVESTTLRVTPITVETPPVSMLMVNV
ncbi:MAG: hypothetical protein BWY59_00183 [Verrucomicrobia bacterium ADurb.Bin345]|nr:MAG: hypothetical protein BWY59_00183 [Verrucomicrobia bacterium ADurb.Bin345]